MLDLLPDIILMPGLIAGLVIGGGGAYFFGVRDPFLIGLAAAIGGILGLALDLGIPWRPRSRTDEKNAMGTGKTLSWLTTPNAASGTRRYRRKRSDTSESSTRCEPSPKNGSHTSPTSLHW
jgi:hypothetical protein